MIKAILFDFDGVLTIDKFGSQSLTKYISDNSSITLANVESSYYKFNKNLLNGTITHRDMWKDFCNDIGQLLDYNILNQAFKDTKIDQNMVELLKELKLKYLIGMVTDNKVDRMETIFEFHDLKQYFDVVSISAKIKSGKQEKYIFEETIKKLNVHTEECIFIDNNEENLVIPKQMGIKTILFDDETRDFLVFKQQLQQYLL